MRCVMRVYANLIIRLVYARVCVSYYANIHISIEIYRGSVHADGHSGKSMNDCLMYDVRACVCATLCVG